MLSLYRMCSPKYVKNIFDIDANIDDNKCYYKFEELKTELTRKYKSN